MLKKLTSATHTQREICTESELYLSEGRLALVQLSFDYTVLIAEMPRRVLLTHFQHILCFCSEVSMCGGGEVFWVGEPVKDIFILVHRRFKNKRRRHGTAGSGRGRHVGP